MLRTLVLVVTLCLTTILHGVAAGEAEILESRTFTDASGKIPGSLPYRFLGAPTQPSASAATGAKLPLLLCMHGAGERGNDNARQVGNFKPLFSGTNRSAFPCFVAIPQVAPNALWATYGWHTKTDHQAAEPSPHLALAKALVDHLVKTEAVDPARIYVLGLSMGGYGTWEFAQRWPVTIAAAVPVCGGGDVTQVAQLAKLPLWAFHGDKDKTITIDKTQNAIDAIMAVGGKPKFTTYAGVGHGAWDKAFNEPELLPWLFAQRRASAP